MVLKWSNCHKTLLTGQPSASFCSLKTALFSLGLLIGVHHKKRYINV